MAVYGNMVITQQGADLYAKIQTGKTLTFTRMQIGSGEISTQLSAALSSGVAYNSLSVQALTSPVANGDTITIGTGGTTQTVTASAAAAIGATTISVTTFTANAAYAVGTTVTTVTDQTKLTALLTPVDYFSINSISTTSGTANIRAIYENTNLTQSTYVCEVGLFAQDPDLGEILYAYANAGSQGDTYPPSADGPFSNQFQANIAIGNSTSVTANVPSTTYVATTQVGAANGVASLDANSNVVQMLSILADLLGSTSVVLSGGVATKDGTTANQLDVTAANVYFSTGEHINFAASSSGEYKTTTVSTTYYLDYNNDGTTSFGTAHSTKTGYVPICQVTTDASGNISVITDERPTTVNLLTGAIGAIKMGAVQVTSISGNGANLTNITASQVGAIPATAEGAASGVATLDASSHLVQNVPWANILSHPTTLGGYGITDAVNSSTLGAANGVATLDASSNLVQSANKLGGVTAANYARTDVSPTFTQLVTFNGNIDTVAGAMEHGNPNAAGTPFIDFHSSGNNIDYDARIIASGGNSTVGQGTLNVEAVNFQHNGNDLTDISQFGSSLSGNGYQKLPGGLILQWAVASIPNGANTNITLPIAFPNACLGASATVEQSEAGVTVSVASFSTTAVQVYQSGSGINMNIFVIAIGH